MSLVSLVAALPILILPDVQGPTQACTSARVGNLVVVRPGIVLFRVPPAPVKGKGTGREFLDADSLARFGVPAPVEGGLPAGSHCASFEQSLPSKGGRAARFGYSVFVLAGSAREISANLEAAWRLPPRRYAGSHHDIRRDETSPWTRLSARYSPPCPPNVDCAPVRYVEVRAREFGARAVVVVFTSDAPPPGGRVQLLLDSFVAGEDAVKRALRGRALPASWATGPEATDSAPPSGPKAP